jgi:hypothetical protein
VTKDELLAAIRRDRARLDEQVARVGEARMAEPALEGGRSVKDVLAHISAWEKICLALVRNNQPIRPPPGETSASEAQDAEEQGRTDAINDKVYQDNRNRPPADVVADAQRSYADLLALVDGLSDEALAAALGAGQEGAESSPLVAQLISGNSHEHYQEHSEQIARWLAG